MIQAERINLKDAFASVDENKDGTLTFSESLKLLPKIEKSLKQAFSGTAELRKYFNEVDTNQDGFVDQEEFKVAVREKLAKLLAKNKKS